MLVPTRASERQIVLAASVLGSVSLAVCALAPAAAAVAYILTGLCIAPIFPTAIAWLSKLRPGDARATAWLYPASSVGGTIGPGAIGIVIGQFGLSWAPTVLSAVAVLMTVSFVVATRSKA